MGGTRVERGRVVESDSIIRFVLQSCMYRVVRLMTRPSHGWLWTPKLMMEMESVLPLLPPASRVDRVDLAVFGEVPSPMTIDREVRMPMEVELMMMVVVMMTA